MNELSTKSETGLSIFDSGSFEQMGLIASKLAQSSLIPDTLKGKTDEQTAANCFRVVEQAQRWGLSPFAVMDSASVVHGKLMWEGKLVAAAINQVLHCRLKYEYSGEGENRKVVVSGTLDGETLTIEGTVADWKTTGKGSPWDRLANRDQMLAYRGARQWARRHAPEVILGVYAPDEIDESDMVNVTKGRGGFVRDEVIEPGPITNPEPEPQPEPEPEPEPELEAKVESSAPKGRQKKERLSQVVTFLDATERSSNGKTWWAAQVETLKGATVEMNTFSTTMAERLGKLFNGDKIEVTFTQTSKGGFALEDFWEVEAKTEGGIV